MIYRGWKIEIIPTEYEGWFDYIVSRKKIKESSPTSHIGEESAIRNAKADIDFYINDKKQTGIGTRRWVKQYYRSKKK